MKVINAIVVVSVLDNKQSKQYNAVPLTEFARRCQRTRNHICKLINEDRIDMVHLFEEDKEKQPRYILLNPKAKNELENFKRIDELKKEKI